MSYATFFKDWVYPIADLAVKIAAGILLAFYLNRRGWRDKRKEKLIDSYLEYLDESAGLFKSRYDSCLREFWQLLLSNIRERVADKGFLSQVHSAIVDTTGTQGKRLKDVDKIDIGGIYTYKFCFLLGKKYYFKHVMPHERKLSEFITNPAYEHNLAVDACKDGEIHQALTDLLRVIDARDSVKLKQDLESISHLANKFIGSRIETDMEHCVHPYSVRIAESIDRL